MITQYTAIALTYKIKATGSRRVGEIMVSVFFVFFVLCLLVVCDRIYHDVQYGTIWYLGHSNLVHKPSSSYVITLYDTKERLSYMTQQKK